MQHRRRLACWWSVITLTLAGSSFAVVGMGIVAASAGAEALAASIEALQREMVSESASRANRDKLFSQLRAAREQLMPIKEHNEAMVTGVTARNAELERSYGGADPAGWRAADRAEYERNRHALELMGGVQAKLDSGWEHLKWLQARQNVEGFDPFKNKIFQDRLKALAGDVSAVSQAYQEFGDDYNVETATLDPGSAITVVKATHVTVRNDSQDMLFKVSMAADAEPISLKPGESAPFRLGDHGCVAIRAISWDATRQQVMNVAERFASGEMRTAKLHEKNLPYFIHYGTDTLATLIRSEKEAYRWTMGRNVSQAVGKASPWAPSRYESPAPQISSSHPEKVGDVPPITDDQVLWYIPAVENTTVEFGFQVLATVEWLTQRRMANGQQPSKTEPVASSGTLTVTVAP